MPTLRRLVAPPLAAVGALGMDPDAATGEEIGVPAGTNAALVVVRGGAVGVGCARAVADLFSIVFGYVRE